MSRQSAERAVIVSALVVASVYAYRLVTEGHSSKGGSLVGVGAPPNIGRFITGWGFAFLVIAIVAEAAPAFGGSLAILVATGDVLANGSQVAVDVNHKLGAPDVQPTGNKIAQQLSASGIGQPLAHPLAVPTLPGQVTR